MIVIGGGTEAYFAVNAVANRVGDVGGKEDGPPTLFEQLSRQRRDERRRVAAATSLGPRVDRCDTRGSADTHRPGHLAIAGVRAGAVVVPDADHAQSDA